MSENKNMDKIIDKIRKILDLANNNPNENEAQSAALKAQKLMTEYDLSIMDIDSKEVVEAIDESMIFTGVGNKWKNNLASVIAKNFKCKYYTRNKRIIIFYGHKVDAQIAAETFEMLFKTGNKLANNYYQKKKRECENLGERFYGSGVKNCYLVGFVEGLEQSLDKQCTALAITIPQDVIKAFESFSEGMKKSNLCITKVSAVNAQEHYNTGIQDGKNILVQKALVMG